ncbi:SDR family oxidoreductase [Kribbella flavida]|uniref:SDR family oxidoreductase n=1 Tax=Kribbella flavida TaxID=182640 RepID=UPI00019BD7B0|nr:SDR family oxidoreductase [Kribbella flavida]
MAELVGDLAGGLAVVVEDGGGRLRRIEETVTGRIGVPSDVANTLSFLASPAAGHITAQMIQVNGGAESSH